MDKKSLPTSAFLKQVIKSQNSDQISIDELKIALHERGFGVLMLFFALPALFVPGVATIFAIPLLFLSMQLLLGFAFPWLPKWISKKSVKRKVISFMILKSSPTLSRIEKFLRPRLAFFSSDKGTKIVGLATFICAFFIALPLPLSNFLPGIAIVLMSLGLLSKDGLMIIFGMLVGLAGIAIVFSILLVGKEIVVALFRWFL